MTDSSAELLDLICTRSLKTAPTPSFKLSSGALSPYYVDLKRTSLLPRGQYLIGKAVFERIKNLDVHGIGGLTLGADPIALAVSLVSGLEGRPIPAFIVRKEAKSHGTERWIEGDLPKAARVVIVDDVITTGGSALKAFQKVTAEGHRVVKIIALVDREEGGGPAIRSETGLELEALYTIHDLKKRTAALEAE